MDEVGPTFEILLGSDLHTYEFNELGGLDPASLDTLPSSPVKDVHGTLEIRLRGRPLPSLGYWGPHDVCISAWASVLVQLRNAVIEQQSDPFSFTFDDYEQGQPSYHFAYNGQEVLISVLDGQGGGQAPPDWFEVSCDPAELVAAVTTFVAALRVMLVDAAGSFGSDWLDERLTNEMTGLLRRS